MLLSPLIDSSSDMMLVCCLPASCSLDAATDIDWYLRRNQTSAAARVLRSDPMDESWQSCLLDDEAHFFLGVWSAGDRGYGDVGDRWRMRELREPSLDALGW